ITLEGSVASLPPLSSSGSWGSSGKSFSEQSGTPIGTDIIYFSRYEDTFYELKVDFPLEKVKDYMQRAYALSEVSFYDKPLQEYEKLGRFQSYSSGTNPYNSFNKLVFGFAPKGMVVVWLRFSGVQIELGRYQAKVIKNDKELEKKLFASWSMTREEVRKEIYKDKYMDLSPKKWDDYRIRYNWKPLFESNNKGFKAFRLGIEYYNAESETFLRPWINTPAMKNRAVPKIFSFSWETSKEEKYHGLAYFDWSETKEIFDKAGTDKNIKIQIAEDNKDFQLMMGEKIIPLDSARIFKSDDSYRESY
ncbi:DUF2931 family protein, partial [Chishuiella sp.]|uniref:DUF2931 family protein n=1 Tax=Chishuiella sp. TaxID=1969467 RepID=UPI0028AE27C1